MSYSVVYYFNNALSSEFNYVEDYGALEIGLFLGYIFFSSLTGDAPGVQYLSSFTHSALSPIEPNTESSTFAGDYSMI